MYDLHLAIHMFLYVYVTDPGNVVTKSWLAPLATRINMGRGRDI
jgi:hypothetical protein